MTTDVSQEPLSFTHRCLQTSTRLVAGALTTGALLFSPGIPATAQEVISVEGLKLQYTNIKTGAPIAYGEGEYPWAVQPMLFDCPGRRRKQETCTVQIDLSTQFSGITEGAVAGAALMFDDSADGIMPSHIIGMDSTSHTGLSNTRTFTWFKARVPVGVHRIHAFLILADGLPQVSTAGSHSRVLKVHVYKP
jgi:hypothetical protein